MEVYVHYPFQVKKKLPYLRSRRTLYPTRRDIRKADYTFIRHSKDKIPTARANNPCLDEKITTGIKLKIIAEEYSQV
jgi:hypothetical protein